MKRQILVLFFLLFWVFLTAQSEDWLWVIGAGGANSDRGRAIATDIFGNCYVTGNYSGTTTFGSTTLISSGSDDIFVAKLDTYGNWIWAIKAGGPGVDAGYGIATDPYGNCYVTGYFQGTAAFGNISIVSNGSSDIFVTKLDTNGNWLNMAEIELNIMQKQCLDRRIPNIDALSDQVTAWTKARNNKECRINWQFTTQDSRVKLKRLYPTIDD